MALTLPRGVQPIPGKTLLTIRILLHNQVTGQGLSALKTQGEETFQKLTSPAAALGAAQAPKTPLLHFPNPSLGPGMAQVPKIHLWVPQKLELLP